MFNITSGPGSGFVGSATFVWADINGLHPELTIKSIDWNRYDTKANGGSLLNSSNVAVNTALTFTKLTTDITAGQTTLPVLSTSGFGSTGATGTLYVESEAMTYTVASGTALTVTRGVLGTTGAPHVSTTEVEKVMTTTLQAPSNWPTIQDGQALGFTLHMTYDSSHKNTKLTLSSSIIRNVCIKYRVASDPLLTQSCNLVGRLAVGATQNPGSCD